MDIETIMELIRNGFLKLDGMQKERVVRGLGTLLSAGVKQIELASFKALVEDGIFEFVVFIKKGKVRGAYKQLSTGELYNEELERIGSTRNCKKDGMINLIDLNFCKVYKC